VCTDGPKCRVPKIGFGNSLAFLAPDLVKAAIDGRLPHGIGVARPSDLSAEWSRQHQMLGPVSVSWKRDSEGQ